MATDSEVDSVIVDYFVECFLMGEQAYVGEKTLAAFQDKFPDFNRWGTRRTPRAHKALKGWRKLSPARSRVRRALALWMAVCAELCRRDQHQMAAFVLVCVECYLRPSEGFRLRRKDLVEPSSFTHLWGLVVCAEEIGEPSKTQ